MSRKYKFLEQDRLYFVSYSVVYWLDVFIRQEYRNIWIESVEYCQKEKGLEVYGWCLMTSHAHMIIGSEKIAMQDIMRDLKKYTSKELRKAISEHPQESRKEWLLWMCERAGKKNSNNNNFQFWQQNNHPLVIKDDNMFKQCLAYIHNNPVTSGFVKNAEDWLYSSAAGYEKNNGLLKLHY